MAKSNKSGGFFFLFSLAALIFVATWNTRFLIGVIANSSIKLPLILLASTTLGWMIAKFLLRAHLATFIHELKHAVVSNLVGNKAKEMKIRRNSGHFQYEYTETTKRYNAFISLAPYCFPLFTAPTLAVVSSIVNDRIFGIIAVGIALGADLQCGWRDVAPHQTDFSDLRGGFTIGLIYVTAASVVLVTLITAWAAGGWAGVGHLGAKYLLTFKSLVE